MAVAVGDPVILARLPGYRVATTTVTSDSATFTTTETVVASVTGSLISGVKYRVCFDGGFQSSAACTLHVNIREDSVSGTILTQRRADISTNETLSGPYAQGEYTASSTGSKTFVATGDQVAGSGNVNLNAGTSFPTKLWIEVVE